MSWTRRAVVCSLAALLALSVTACDSGSDLPDSEVTEGASDTTAPQLHSASRTRFLAQRDEDNAAETPPPIPPLSNVDREADWPELDGVTPDDDDGTACAATMDGDGTADAPRGAPYAPDDPQRPEFASDRVMAATAELLAGHAGEDDLPPETLRAIDQLWPPGPADATPREPSDAELARTRALSSGYEGYVAWREANPSASEDERAQAKASFVGSARSGGLR